MKQLDSFEKSKENITTGKIELLHCSAKIERNNSTYISFSAMIHQTVKEIAEKYVSLGYEKGLFRMDVFLNEKAKKEEYESTEVYPIGGLCSPPTCTPRYILGKYLDSTTKRDLVIDYGVNIEKSYFNLENILGITLMKKGVCL